MYGRNKRRKKVRHLTKKMKMKIECKSLIGLRSWVRELSHLETSKNKRKKKKKKYKSPSTDLNVLARKLS
jgi:hypothetical protein